MTLSDKIQFKTASKYQDVVIIGEMLSGIWNDNIKVSDYDLIFQHIKKFPQGHMIAEQHNRPIATSIAFPIEMKPAIDEFSSKHSYDFFSMNSRY